MNLILLMMLLALGCGAICARLSPRYLREIAAYLMATADATDEARATFRRKHMQYRQEMGLDEKPFPRLIR
jgi:hypothetical protein